MLMIMAELVAILVAAIFGAFLIMSLLGPSKPMQATSLADLINPKQSNAVFLFQAKELIDATAEGWSLINEGAGGLTDFETVSELLTTEFAEFAEAFEDTGTPQTRLISSHDAGGFVDVQRFDGQLRVELAAEAPHTFDAMIDRLKRVARDAKTSLLHDIKAFSPQLIWHQDETGKLLWANDAYTQAIGDAPIPAPLRNADPKTRQTRRVAIRLPNNPKERWFDVTTTPRDGGMLGFASDATDVVRAEATHNEFVQTLGRTFAELSIGLAIFDRNRELTMFNPALLDMTNLPADFLSARPAIDTVLDRLRELRMMPEPRNYASWREQFLAVENAVKNGTYSQNWALPDGQMLRVTGKPYPGGAFAILFADISAEVSLTRRFRLDIETGQAVLDTLGDAIAVFSSTGTLVMSNKSYADLWAGAQEVMLDHRILQTEMATWQNHCIPTPMWKEMREFIQQLGARKPWSDYAMLDDGRHLACHAHPIAGGMTMVRFVIAPPSRPEIRKLLRPDPALQAVKR